MKNLFLFFAFLSTLTVETYAQAEYKSLESFNNDTLKYIRYNFEENKKRYIGKKFDMFIKEFEPDLYYDYIYKDDSFRPRKLYAIRISYLADTLEFLFARKRNVPFENILYVIVRFEKPYSKTTKDIGDRTLLGIPNFHDNIFKDLIVEDLEVVNLNKVIESKYY